MSERHIPLVDLSLFNRGSETDKARFVEQLGAAFSDIGFVGVINHDIPQSLIDSFYAESKAFFALPSATKIRYEHLKDGNQLGYTSFGIEKAKHSKVADLKEFFQIGQEVPANLTANYDYAPNARVAERPNFVDTGIQLFRAFEKTGQQLLNAIALFLELEEDYFVDKVEYGNSILRAIYYPAIKQEPESAIRAEQHEDINLITLLVGASAGGLQVLTKENKWEEVMPTQNEIVINVGDMLQRLTNNFMKSTTHRVVNPPRSEWHLPRLSIPFFLHPRKEMDLSCLEGCVSDENPIAYPPITAIEYLEERLAEIGLKK